MKIDPELFRVLADTDLKLKNVPTKIDPFYESKKDYHKQLKAGQKDLMVQQHILEATGSYALLIIIQAMDAGGKDGTIKHVMSGVNPQGCFVSSFKEPTPLELRHDFLWRAITQLPERGKIGIFNRSYYEDVLIARVHPEILKRQNLPPSRPGSDFWEDRFKSICDLEAHLHKNGTRIIKLFLHISKDEQSRRLLDRIEDPNKNWKLSTGDFTEREYWDQYMLAFEKSIASTSTDDSPWYIIPADDKKNARLIISSIINKTLNDLKLSYPQATKRHYQELANLKKRLTGGANAKK